MQYRNKTLIWTVVLSVFALAISWWAYNQMVSSKQLADKSASNSFTFNCINNKNIKASFEHHFVRLKLSDGRYLMLKQAEAAVGARYANNNEKIVFWNKGNTAFITEDDSLTFKNCLRKGQDDLVNLKMYQSESDNIIFRYPGVLQKYRDAIKDTTGWSYASTKNGNLITQFKLAKSDQPKTNLSEAIFSVGKSNNAKAVKNCMKAPPAAAIKTDSVKKDGVVYMRSRYADAGAGNFYQIIQYRTLQNNSCYSIEEMVHSTNIHNYPPERGISEFDSARVWQALSVPFQTLVFNKK